MLGPYINIDGNVCDQKSEWYILDREVSMKT